MTSSSPTAGSTPSWFDLNLLLTGDWAGAGLVALSTWAFAVAISLVIAVISGASEHLAMITGLVAGGAFGANTLVSTNSGSEQALQVSLGAYPLTVTVAALALLVTLFWRRLRARRPSLSEAVLQAVRTAFVLAVLSAMSSLVLRDKVGPSSLLAGNDQVSLHASVLGSAFGAFVLALLVGLAAVVRKPEWLPPRALTTRRMTGPAVAGLAVTLTVALTFALIGSVVVILASSEARTASFTGLLADLPGIAVCLLLLGIGVSLNAHLGGLGETLDFPGDFHGVATSGSTHVTDLTDTNAWLWLIVVGAIVSIVAGAVATAYLSANLARAQRTLPVFVGLFTLAAPLLAHFATIQVSGDLGGVSAAASLGPSGGAALGCALIVGTLAALFVLALAPQLLPQVAISVSRMQGSFPRQSRGEHDAAEKSGPTGGSGEAGR